MNNLGERVFNSLAVVAAPAAAADEAKSSSASTSQFPSRAALV
jgi:hypothetical protein